jgi:predicted dehydrogenase
MTTTSAAPSPKPGTAAAGDDFHVENVATRRPAGRLPRLGFVGLGWIGIDRMRAAFGAGAGEIAALCDPSPDALEAARRLAPRAVAADSLEELLDLHLDGIVIATPNALHAPQCMTALRRRIPVFCQKPLARTAAETRAVVDAAREANCLLGVDFSYRFTLGMQRIRRLILDAALGDIHAAHLVFHNAYGPDKRWFHDPELSGGGCLLDLGTHLVDLALWTLGGPKVECATGRLLSQGTPLPRGSLRVEDYAAGQIHLAGGGLIQIACSWNAHAGQDAWIEASFFGSAGGASFRNVGGSFYAFTTERFLPGRLREPLATDDRAWGGRALVDWAQRLQESSAYDPRIESAVDVATVLDALRGEA